MPGPMELLFAGVLAVVSVREGVRAVTAGRLFRTLRGADAEEYASLDEGEPATVSGRVVVDEPAPASDDAVGDGGPPVGAYVWRATMPTDRRWIDREDGGLERGTTTFASGIESGRFAVVDGGREVWVETDWLADAHDRTALSEVTYGGVTSNGPLTTYLWDSSYLSLDVDPVEQSPERLTDVVDSHSPDVDLARYGFESKPVREGDTVRVRGEVTRDGGDPVVRGTDGTPLVVTDGAFADLRRTHLARLAWDGLWSVGALAVAGYLVL